MITESQAALAWEHGGLARVIADRINDWNVIERAILTSWLHTLRDPRPHGGRAYLAWVRRHAPKRRRFDDRPTRRDVLLKIGALVLARHWPDALDGLTDMESQRERLRTAKCFVGMEYGRHTHKTLRECLYDEWGYEGTGDAA